MPYLSVKVDAQKQVNNGAPMAYLKDPVIWLSVALGLTLAAGGGALGRVVIRYASEHKTHAVRVEAAKGALALIIIGALFLCDRGFQWRFGGNGEPYIGAFTIGLAVGLPVGWLIEFGGKKSGGD